MGTFFGMTFTNHINSRLHQVKVSNNPECKMAETAGFWIDKEIFLRQALCCVMFACLRKLSLKTSKGLYSRYQAGVLDSIMCGTFFLKLFSKTPIKWIFFKARKRIQVSGYIHFEISSFLEFPLDIWV